MADSFFGFDTSLSNLNDDEGGGEGSEGEYDALNDETFGQGTDEFDWELEHEHLAHQLESSRRHEHGIDDLTNSQLEASLSQLVLDETDAPLHTLGSSVWRHDPPPQPPQVQQLKNVCTVEELERQLRQKQPYNNQNFFQPRFPVILQRPPGLQGPVPLPFAPQQPINNMNQMSQPLNKILNQNQMNPLGQNNQMMQNHVNQLSQSQLGQNQLGQNQLGQSQLSQNQLGQNQLSQNVNQFMQHSQLGFQNSHGNNMMMHQNNMMQNHGINHQNQMQNMNPMGPNNHISQNNQMGHNLNQNANHGQNQLGQNQLGQNVNHVMPNGNQFGQMNQFQHMMGQNRMMVPPPGMNMPRQNFSPNMGQFNPNFRGPIPKPNEQPNLSQQSMVIDKQMMFKNHPQNQTHGQSLNQLNQNINQMGQNMNQMSQNLNQMSQNQSQLGQSMPNANLSPNKGLKSEKKQPSRVYNNSKNMNSQNLTSQNLVQLIQNTHPMLQFNNSYHNATHHPLLNRNQFNLGHPMMNQRPNGSFSSNSGNRSMMNGDERSADEYAGLMSPREKQWLINIQMLQLNSGTPYIHDFYYTVFLERQARKEKEGVKEAHKVNQQNHPFYSGGVSSEPQRRERHNSARHNSTSEDAPRTYVPAQFENSLGKLQCGSVTAPRKIIDLEVVPSEQQSTERSTRAQSVASTNHTEVPREMKRTKQLLLDIEALYLILLRIEELNDPLAISNALILKEREEKQKQLEALQKEMENDQEDESNVFLRNIESVQRRPKQDSPKSEAVDKRQVVNLAVPKQPAPTKNLLDEDKEELVNKMFAGLLHADRLPLVLNVRKGRSLVSRLVAAVGAAHPCLRPVWSRVLRALPSAARRDVATFSSLSAPLARYIENSSGWTCTLECCSLLAEALDPARTPYALTTPFTLSTVCALIDKASTLINTPDATANERQWSKFLKTLARALKNTTLNVARPLKPISEAKLTLHLKQLDSRSTIEILQRGKAAEFDLTKHDVREQLVKYLCL